MAATRVVLNAPDIMCNHCKMAIENAVGKLPGVQSVAVDVDGKTAEVDFDEAVVSLDTLEATMAEEGYQVAGRHVREA
jgi:copper chaperone